MQKLMLISGIPQSFHCQHNSLQLAMIPLSYCLQKVLPFEVRGEIASLTTIVTMITPCKNPPADFPLPCSSLSFIAQCCEPTSFTSISQVRGRDCNSPFSAMSFAWLHEMTQQPKTAFLGLLMQLLC